MFFDMIFGTDISKTVNNLEYNQQKQELIDIDEKTNSILDDNVNQESSISYDLLQELYLTIDSSKSYKDVIELINNFGLPFSDRKYSHGRTIKVAFDEKVTPHTHAKEGDHIEITFLGNNKDENYTLGTLEYFNNEKFITIFQYIDGVYWDFRNGEDAGFYINNYANILGDKLDKNIKVDSKEEQLEYLHNYVK